VTEGVGAKQDDKQKRYKTSLSETCSGFVLLI
jgi:hypothetical protein